MCDGTSTSSPAFTPSARSASHSAAVAELVSTACFTPVVLAELRLELPALRAQDVLARVDRGQDRPLDLVVDRRA